jgi:predicted DNA-binding protein
MTDTAFQLGESHPLGKLTAEVKTMLPEETDELLSFLASAHRMKKAEYIRNVLIEHVHGRAEVIRLRVNPPLRSDS